MSDAGRALRIEDLAAIKTIASAQLSPVGSRVAYTLTEIVLDGIDTGPPSGPNRRTEEPQAADTRTAAGFCAAVVA